MNLIWGIIILLNISFNAVLVLGGIWFNLGWDWWSYNLALSLAWVIILIDHIRIDRLIHDLKEARK
jgi:hypothetical protein